MQGDLSRLVGSGPESFNVSQNQQKPPKKLCMLFVTTTLALSDDLE